MIDQSVHLTSSELMDKLRGSIDEVLKPLIPSGTPVALVDFPDHSNVGDSAIWLGEKEYLKSAGVSIVYECSASSYSRDAMRKRLGNGIVLIQGGGNLGDVWPAPQRFREKIIGDFLNNKIIQFPRSITFREKDNLEKAKRIFNLHPDLTLLLRDAGSLNFARAHFRCRSELCPDMACMVGPIKNVKPVSGKITYLARSDKESSGSRILNNTLGIVPVDWIAEKRSFVTRLYRLLNHRLILRVLYGLGLSNFVAWLHDFQAQARLNRGIAVLGTSEMVITDRLHGHILSALLGVTHICLDNRNHKIKNYYDTWTNSLESTFWADSPSEAIKEVQARICGGRCHSEGRRPEESDSRSFAPSNNLGAQDDNTTSHPERSEGSRQMLRFAQHDTKISVVTSTYNRCESLRDTLEALKKQDFRMDIPMEIIVVDNNSTDRTAEVVKHVSVGSRWPIRYVFEDKQGISHARNRGILEAQGEFILFTDDDAIPSTQWVSSILRGFNEYKADVVGGPISPLWLAEPPEWLLQPEFQVHLALLDRGSKPIVKDEADSDLLYGANMAFRKDAFDRAGKFRIDLGNRGSSMFLREDSEMLERALKAGMRAVYFPDALMYHKVPPKRMGLRYLRKWRFAAGRSTVMVRRDYRRPPPWLLRDCAEHALKVVWSYLKGARFEGIKFEKLFWFQLGMIYELLARRNNMNRVKE